MNKNTPSPASRIPVWRDLSDAQKGILCILGVTLTFALMDTSAKKLSETYHPFFVVWARYTTQAVGTFIIFAPWLTTLLRTARPKLQIVRSSLLFTATCLFFVSFSFMPLVDVVAVAQVVPLLITALAALILSEKVGPYRWFAVLFGLAGALIILRPGLGGLGFIALLPLGASLAFACLTIATRFLGTEDSVWTTYLYTALVGTVIASLMVPFVWSWPDISDLPLILFMGLAGALGQFLLIVAFTYAPASLLAPFLYSSMVWSAAMGFLVFSEIPDHFTILGATMIVAGGFYVRHRERVRAQKQTN